MTSGERDAEAARAFEALLRAPAAAREAELAELWERNARLAEHVSRLLGADARNADGFLESPPLGRVLTAQTLEAPLSVRGSGEREHGAVDPAAFDLGRYRGMAVLGLSQHAIVLLAEQTEPVRRLVAVKILRGRDASGEAWARFERERQAVASLTHENIARLYDAGTTEDGSPYFVMEYVPGRPLTAFAEEAALSLRDRVRLFVDVCRGVEHAHERGLVHRDLKPGNILAASRSEGVVVKIIDFGVVGAGAGASGWAALTQDGCSVGTPLYMSPEQLRGGASDARSDVYAMGVVLYELLAARPLVEPGTGSLDEAMRRARRGELLDEDVLADLPAGLGRVVLHATAAEAGSRYQSSRGLREDLERWLAGRELSVEPPTAIGRVCRVVRRRATLVAGVSAACVVLLCVGIGGVSLYRHVRAVEGELDAFHEEVSAIAPVMFEQPDALLADLAGSHGQRREQLNRLETFAARLGKGREQDPRLQEAMAALLTAQASLDEEEGLHARADERLRAAMALREQLSAARPEDDEAARLHSLALVRVGDMAKHMRGADAAEPLYLRAMDIDARQAAAAPDDARRRLTLAWSYERLAYLKRLQQNLDETERGHLAQLAAIEGIEGSEAERCRSGANVQLSDVLARTGRVREARERAEAALAHANRAVQLDPSSRGARVSRCVAASNLADTESVLGNHRAALGLYMRNYEVATEVPEQDPLLLRLASTYADRAAHCAQGLDSPEERRLTEAAIEITERVRVLAPADCDVSGRLAVLLRQLAKLDLRDGEVDRGNARLSEALRLYRENLALRPDRAEPYAALAAFLASPESPHLRDLGEAQTLLGRAPPPIDRHDAECLSNGRLVVAAALTSERSEAGQLAGPAKGEE